MTGGKEEVEDACVCVCGFLQPHPFVQRTLPSLLEVDDGFTDRFLFCSPEPHLLPFREVESWCQKHRTYPLKNLTSVYEKIAKAHSKLASCLYYEYDEPAKEVYIQFSDELSEIMNDGWASGSQTLNISKDKRTMIRYTCTYLHIPYFTFC